jgi:TonB family protein
MIKFAVNERSERVVLMNLPLDQFASVRKGRSLSISAMGEFNETFQLASIEPLMKVMDSCVADLRKIWNVDVAGGTSLQSLPTGSLQGLFRGNDYPGIAISRMKGGSVSFVLLINEQGRVADCTVVRTSGVAALDAQSCAVVTERARFQPAIGKDGKPAKATFRQIITWRIQ